MRPLTKKATMGRTFKYYPSSPFSPSVALGALLTRNLGLALGMARVVKRRCLFGGFWLGIVGSMSIVGILGKAPVSPVYSLSPVSSLKLCAKLTSIHLANFIFLDKIISPL